MTGAAVTGAAASGAAGGGEAAGGGSSKMARLSCSRILQLTPLPSRVYSRQKRPSACSPKQCSVKRGIMFRCRNIWPMATPRRSTASMQSSRLSVTVLVATPNCCPCASRATSRSYTPWLFFVLCCTVTVTCAFRYDETSRCRFPLALSKTRSIGENPEAEPAEPQKPSVGSLIRSPRPPCDGTPRDRSAFSVSASWTRCIAPSWRRGNLDVTNQKRSSCWVRCWFWLVCLILPNRMAPAINAAQWPQLIGARGDRRAVRMERLRLLNQAFSEGLITDDEYREHKRVVLCGVDSRASKDPAEPCRSGSGDAKEQLTLEDFDRAVQMCMQSLLELVSQLATVCAQSASAGHAPLVQAAAAPHPRERCAPRRQRQADSRRNRIRPGPFPPGTMRRVDGRAPARGFAFDMQGQHARGGKPVHQRHLELDHLQVRASPREHLRASLEQPLARLLGRSTPRCFGTRALRRSPQPRSLHGSPPQATSVHWRRERRPRRRLALGWRRNGPREEWR